MAGRDIGDLIEGWGVAMHGDFAVLDDLCAANCRIWHSSDDKWMSHREAMDNFLAARGAGRIPDFDDVRILPTAKGFLCQASMTIAPIGKLHIMQLVTAADGAITHVEEYIAPEMDLAAQMAA